jgi:hypothetical protein
MKIWYAFLNFRDTLIAYKHICFGRLYDCQVLSEWKKYIYVLELEIEFRIILSYSLKECYCIEPARTVKDFKYLMGETLSIRASRLKTGAR